MQTHEVVERDGVDASVLDSIEVAAPKATEMLNRAEIDMQISTAKRYPRSLTRVLKQVEEWATLDENTAGSMFYAVPRDGKQVIGESIRFAEILLSAWGNIRHTVRIIDIADEFLTARGEVFDLETNTQHACEIVRRITTKYGKRYSQDMIQTTAQAAASIALRNATFRVIPLGPFRSVLYRIRDASLGKGVTIEKRRAAAIDYWAKQGVKEDRVLSAVGRAGVPELTIDDLVFLRGVAEAIKTRETTIEAAFPPVEKPDLSSRIAAAKAAATVETPATQTTPHRETVVTPDGEVIDDADKFEDQRAKGGV